MKRARGRRAGDSAAAAAAAASAALPACDPPFNSTKAGPNRGGLPQVTGVSCRYDNGKTAAQALSALGSTCAIASGSGEVFPGASAQLCRTWSGSKSSVQKPPRANASPISFSPTVDQ